MVRGTPWVAEARRSDAPARTASMACCSAFSETGGILLESLEKEQLNDINIELYEVDLW